jgi:hypothetical protein
MELTTVRDKATAQKKQVSNVSTPPTDHLTKSVALIDTTLGSNGPNLLPKRQIPSLELLLHQGHFAA